MTKFIINQSFWTTIIVLGMVACKPLEVVDRQENKVLPDSYKSKSDTTNVADLSWKQYFTDDYLIALIDSALLHNQELNITVQEVQALQNEVMAKKGEYLPSVSLGTGAELDKVGRYTRNGALEANNEIKPGRDFPEPFSNFQLGAYASWELDVWKKLRNAKKSAYLRYLSSIDGRNFMVTNLIGEITNSYFELLALDAQLEIIRENIAIQDSALMIVRLQKESARVTELAVKRFEAHVLNTTSVQFAILQAITETENRINFLVGRFPQPVDRTLATFSNPIPSITAVGLPAQLLENRPDVRQAELELEAAKLDVKVAKARFYPSIGLSAGLGLEAFGLSDFVRAPESIFFNLGGDLMAPLINRAEIKALYRNANARQVQAIEHYERTILNAYMEVANELASIRNLKSIYDLKKSEVDALNESIEIANNLFRSARADYMEVLMTQREALESRFELVDTKMEQMHAWIDIYRVLGGGWK